LGADKVFLRTTDEGDVSSLLFEAANFFGKFFSSSVRWNKEIVGHERGAWVRIYGVPLHAWNLNFFKLCVCDSGRLMQVDEFTLEKERLDFARVLVATSSLKVINVIAKVVVDGVLMDFKVVEEWGFSLGEDACLGDEEVEHKVDRSDTVESHEELAGEGDVVEFLNKLSEDWQEERREGLEFCSNGTRKDIHTDASFSPKKHTDASCELIKHDTILGNQGFININSKSPVGGKAYTHPSTCNFADTDAKAKGAASNVLSTSQRPSLVDGEGGQQTCPIIEWSENCETHNFLSSKQGSFDNNGSVEFGMVYEPKSCSCWRYFAFD